ncbi:velvet factor-domain-containing protein [Mycena vitilis]|nr:velvet factor-domain-containing protein [Mycena vitilis]
MRRQYELTVRQEPKQARMCGIGGKADRRPIDPPVIVQLRVIDPAAPPPPPSSAPSSDSTSSASTSGPSSSTNAPRDADDAEADEPPYTNLAGYAQSFLQNPYYFMFASLAKPDDDTELHWLKDGRTRCTTGSVVSSLYALKDPTAPAPATSANSSTTNSNGNGNGNGNSGAGAAGKDPGPTTAPPASDAGFFVFPDLSVRTEGSYRLKLSLFEVVGNDVRHCKSIYSAPFYVYTAKKFPGVEGAFLRVFLSFLCFPSSYIFCVILPFVILAFVILVFVVLAFAVLVFVIVVPPFFGVFLERDGAGGRSRIRVEHWLGGGECFAKRPIVADHA